MQFKVEVLLALLMAIFSLINVSSAVCQGQTYSCSSFDDPLCADFNCCKLTLFYYLFCYYLLTIILLLVCDGGTSTCVDF